MLAETMTTDTLPPRDAEGYLLDPAHWDESVADRLAAAEGLTLDATTWALLRFMREFWRERQIAPDVRHVVDFLAGHDDIDKRTAKARLFALFPYGYVKQACRIAGMKRPRAWSTG